MAVVQLSSNGLASLQSRDENFPTKSQLQGRDLHQHSILIKPNQ